MALNTECPLPATFFGSVQLDPLLLASAAGQVGQAVIQHLAGLLGADVKVRLEIEAHIPGGVPDKVQRNVTENARTLKFNTAEFEYSARGERGARYVCEFRGRQR